MLVATHATDGLSRLHAGETLHPFDRKIVLVQGDEKDASHGRHLEIGAAVRLHRHGPQDPFEGERPAVADRLHAAGVVDGHGKRFEHQQFFDLARLHARHIAAVVHVGQHHAAGGFLGLHARLEDGFARARRDGARLVAFQFRGEVAGRELEDFLRATFAIHHDQ